jgi:hypothetical protein
MEWRVESGPDDGGLRWTGEADTPRAAAEAAVRAAGDDVTSLGLLLVVAPPKPSKGLRYFHTEQLLRDLGLWGWRQSCS